MNSAQTRAAKAVIISIVLFFTLVVALLCIGTPLYMYTLPPEPTSTQAASPTPSPTVTLTDALTPTPSLSPTTAPSPPATTTATDTATPNSRSLETVTPMATATATWTVTLTPPPTATTVPTATSIACQSDAAIVADVTIPPGTTVAAGQTLTKTWRIGNIGTCAWDAGYRLILVGGEAMTISTSFPVPFTSPGTTADLSISVTAPTSPGIHFGQWQLTGPSGQFGDAYGVILNVVPAPPPPQCPGAPVIASFDANPVTIAPGQSSTLSWGRVDNATSASIDQGIGGIATPGSQTVRPTQTTTYTLTATGCGGSTTQQVTVVVVPSAVASPSPRCPGPPTIASFTASPTTIVVGQSSRLSWGAVTNATSAVIQPDIGGVATPGSSAVKPTKTTTYTLTATGCGGTVRKLVKVTVSPP